MTAIELLIIICAVAGVALIIKTATKRGKAMAKNTQIVRVDEFFKKYKSVMPDDLMQRISKATLDGEEYMKIDIYTVEMLDGKLAGQSNGE
jgi:hypothetical protein